MAQNIKASEGEVIISIPFKEVVTNQDNNINNIIIRDGSMVVYKTVTCTKLLLILSRV